MVLSVAFLRDMRSACGRTEWHQTFSISAKFDDKLYEKLDKDFSELEYKYQRLLYIRFMDDTLTAEFSDNPGTMKQFRNCF